MVVKLYQQCRRNTGKRKYNFPCIMPLSVYVGALLIILDYPYVVNICFRWLDQVDEFCLDSDSDDMNLSWSAFHAHHEKGNCESNLAISFCFLCLKSKRHHQSRHSIDVISEAVQYLKPGQTPVMAFDQPLFDICILRGSTHYCSIAPRE